MLLGVLVHRRIISIYLAQLTLEAPLPPGHHDLLAGIGLCLLAPSRLERSSLLGLILIFHGLDHVGELLEDVLLTRSRWWLGFSGASLH